MHEAIKILSHAGETGILALAVWQGFKFMQNTSKDMPIYSKCFGWAIAVGGWLFVLNMALTLFEKI